MYNYDDIPCSRNVHVKKLAPSHVKGCTTCRALHRRIQCTHENHESGKQSSANRDCSKHRSAGVTCECETDRLDTSRSSTVPRAAPKKFVTRRDGTLKTTRPQGASKRAFGTSSYGQGVVEGRMKGRTLMQVSVGNNNVGNPIVADRRPRDPERSRTHLLERIRRCSRTDLSMRMP